MSAETLPEVLPALALPATWQAVEFISDLHLHASEPDNAAQFRSYLATTDADAVFILGDLFEVWVGDDARFEGFEAEVCAALRNAAHGLGDRAGRPPVTLYFMGGNRDFLVGSALAEDVGLTLLNDPCCVTAFGQRVLLTHGDAWCLADTAYMQFRQQVRASAWQTAFLAQPLADRQAWAQRVRAHSEAQKQGQASTDWTDLDPDTMSSWLRANECNLLVHGHTHQPGVFDLPGAGLRRIVLPDWHVTQDATHRGHVLCWQASGWSTRPF